ncbi:unnamed protein product [Arabidopsis thaliana]|uniref:Uncharacterized protein n=1 Tax=Arabidopsis thaliana TaxID=3702 RepID=A0A5S9WY60_ARATH|nr:unnamed protein product [Arabidopsis thaliana]
MSWRIPWSSTGGDSPLSALISCCESEAIDSFVMPRSKAFCMARKRAIDSAISGELTLYSVDLNDILVCDDWSMKSHPKPHPKPHLAMLHPSSTKSKERGDIAQFLMVGGRSNGRMNGDTFPLHHSEGT